MRLKPGDLIRIQFTAVGADGRVLHAWQTGHDVTCPDRVEQADSLRGSAAAAAVRFADLVREQLAPPGSDR